MGPHRQFVEIFQTLLGVLVPEIEGAVGACSAEGAELLVEADGVDSVDVRRAGVTMALEGEVFPLLVLVDVVNLHAPFYRAYGVPFLV